MGIAELARPAGLPESKHEPELVALHDFIWQAKPELRLAFDISTRAGREAMAIWLDITCGRATAAENTSSPIASQTSIAEIARPKADMRRLIAFAARYLPRKWRNAARGYEALWLARKARRLVVQTPTPPPLGPFASLAVRRCAAPAGVNLIGHLRAESGLGQHARYLADALRAAGVPTALVNFEPGLRNNARAQANPHRVNLVLMSPASFADAFCHFGQAFFGQRYNILVAVWELGRWPAQWTGLLRVFDEVWAPSLFVEQAIRQAKRCDVKRVPTCIALPQEMTLGRRHFGLPEGKFLFLLMLDAFSFLERKNPLAAIRAFQAAFGEAGQNAGLVVKTMNATRDNIVWREILKHAKDDPRITVINRKLSHGEVIALYRATDCLVSTHRSEGLGLCIAEAMYCGKPVIATAYAGPADILRAEFARPIKFDLVPVRLSDYPHANGQSWAEICPADLAAAMKMLHDDRALATSLGSRAASFARATMNPQVAGTEIRRLLQESDLL